jgi:hypothetical protein
VTTSRTAPDPRPGGPLALVGGPLGVHASARAGSLAATTLALLAATAATMAAAVGQKAHCVQKGWSGSDQFWHACFSDLPAQYQLGHLDSGLSAYVGGTGATADHPVLTGSAMALLGGLVPQGSFLAQTRWYFALWALLATVCALTLVWFTAASRPRHAHAAAQVALSPVLLLAGLVSVDLLGVALAAAGLWAWGRRRPVQAGVLLGLGVMARTYPLLLLLALVLLGVRTGRLVAVRRVLAAAAATVAVVLLPFLVGNPSAILRSTLVWWDSAAGLGSPWMLPQLVGLSPLPPGGVTALAVAGLLVTVIAGALFTLSTWRRPTLPEVAFVLVALALVTGKAFPVQASLWLVPLAALCGVRWRDSLVWAGAEALHFVAVWLYVAGLSTPDRGLPPGWYALFLTLRVAAVGYLVWRVWSTAAARPEHSPPEEPLDSDDPDSDAVVDELAGDFTDATDQLLVRFG